MLFCKIHCGAEKIPRQTNSLTQIAYPFFQLVPHWASAGEGSIHIPEQKPDSPSHKSAQPYKCQGKIKGYPTRGFSFVAEIYKEEGNRKIVLISEILYLILSSIELFSLNCTLALWHWCTLKTNKNASLSTLRKLLKTSLLRTVISLTQDPKEKCFFAHVLNNR